MIKLNHFMETTPNINLGDKKEVPAKKKENKRVAGMGKAVIVFLLLLLTGYFGFYLQSEKGSLESSLANVEAEISDTNGKLEELRGQSVGNALQAKQSIEALSGSQVVWSDLIDRLDNLFPKDPNTRRTAINISSYTGTKEGLNLVATSRDVNFAIEMIRALKISPFFKNELIPSVSRGVNEEGDTIFSFSVNFDYETERNENDNPES